jgi:hypothetical protein
MTIPLNGKKLFGNGRGFSTLNATNPTPIRFGTVQDMSLAFKRKIEEIYGEGQLAEDISSGTMSVTGKITMAQSNARIASDALFGNAGATGITMESDAESGTVAASSPYTITVANSSTWTQDLGVMDVATGNRMVRVASSSETAGVSYSVAAGVYKFASGDEGAAKKLWYLYTVSSSGEQVALTNQKQGKLGLSGFVLVFPWTPPGGTEQQDVVQLNACLVSDYELSTKLEAYGKPPISFAAACDTTGSMGTLNFAQAA